jgi:hypothetical protein
MGSFRKAALLLVAGAALLAAPPAHAGHGEADLQENATHLANSPQTDATNSDLAFWGDHVYAGNYDGFRILDVSNRSNPQELVDFDCPGAQNDLSVWDTGERRLLFLSVDSVQGDDLCGSGAGAVPPLKRDPEDVGFEGVRVFDVTDPRSPRYLRAVFTDCGSHTQTLVPARLGADGSYAIDAENPDRVLIYVSSYALASALEPRCPDLADPAPLNDPSHNKISIVEVPFDAPENADVLKEVPLHPTTLGFPAQDSRGCHDIGVFLELELAAGACQGEGQVWDISDPANPDTMGAQRIFNENINYWHSASFTWDGRVLIFGDEEGGAAITHGCVNTGEDQLFGTGGTWFYDREDLSGAPGEGGINVAPASGSYIQDREQLSSLGLICTAHNYNAIPVTDRYLLSSAYYQAGSSVLNFSNRKAIREIAYYDLDGVDTNPGAGEPNPAADTWSTYFYNGNLFANDTARGVDVFGLTGRAAELVAGARSFDHFNPQTQERTLGPDAADGGGGSGGGSGGGGAGAFCANTVVGTKKADKLRGTDGPDRISGKNGSDRIAGRGGGDCIRGGGGGDRLLGGPGDDEIRPGRGADRVRAGIGNDLINAARGGRDRIDCGRGDDVAVINPRKDRAARNCEQVPKRGRDDLDRSLLEHLQSH